MIPATPHLTTAQKSYHMKIHLSQPRSKPGHHAINSGDNRDQLSIDSGRLEHGVADRAPASLREMQKPARGTTGK
jgi:hypothetical protein